MNAYSVVFLAEAEEELVAIWGAATDLSRITDSAHEADRILGSSPQDRAVYLSENLWLLEVVPLRFYFAIREEDRLVEVSNVIRAVD